MGRLTKTDRIDAAVLALLGRPPERRQACPVDRNFLQFKDLASARTACVEEQANRRKRRAELQPGPAADALERLNATTDHTLSVLDRAIAETLAATAVIRKSAVLA